MAQLYEKWEALFDVPAPSRSRGNRELRLGYASRIWPLASWGRKPHSLRCTPQHPRPLANSVEKAIAVRSLLGMRDENDKRAGRFGPNPLPPATMTPRERRAELCTLLATGLIRLRMREQGQHIEREGEFPLHNSLDQSGSAGPTERRAE